MSGHAIELSILESMTRDKRMVHLLERDVSLNEAHISSLTDNIRKTSSLIKAIGILADEARKDYEMFHDEESLDKLELYVESIKWLKIDKKQLWEQLKQEGTRVRWQRKLLSLTRSDTNKL